MSSGVSSQPAGDHRRRGLRKALIHGAVLMVCFALFLVVCKLYLDQYIEIRRLEERKQRRIRELVEQRSTLDAAEREVAFLGTLKGVEKLARERLKYIRHDEVIIVPIER